MTTDFKHHVPIWVRYLEFTDVNSDKFYEARIDEDGAFYLTKRWGARPDTRGGQSKQEAYPSQLAAQAAGDYVLNQKIAKGYQHIAWPFGAAAMPDFSQPEEVERWLEL